MRTFTKDEVQNILALHRDWILSRPNGVRADFSNADLRSADLRGADLRGADLRGADLRGAYLSGADLRGADLRGAYPRGADLRGADLSGADLRGADLSGAYLSGTDLRGAYLRGAYLSGAYLRGADLSGAYLRGADLRGAYLRDPRTDDKLLLVGDRPWFSIGPIGTDLRIFCGWMTDKGIRIQAGCFFGTPAEFKQQVKETRGGTLHETEYMAALKLIECHFKLFPAPKVEKAKKEAA